MSYFGYHAVNGDFSLYALERMKSEQNILLQQLSKLRKERMIMESRIALMQPKNIDPDMLDERVRANLNFIHPDEVIILRSSQ